MASATSDLPSLRRYQIYTAWWQLAAQDINPIAYAPEFAWPNFHAQARDRTQVGTLTRPASTRVFSLTVVHANAMLSRRPMCICVYLLTAWEPARHEDVVRTSAVCVNVHVTDWLEGAEQQGRSADSA